MSKTKALHLADIARTEAASGNAWAALDARLAADSILAGETLEEYPDVLIQAERLRDFSLKDGGVADAITAWRKMFYNSIGDPGAATAIRQALRPVDLENTPLDPSESDGFAIRWTGGRSAAELAADHLARAKRMAPVAARLAYSGDLTAAGRIRTAAYTSAFLAHHAAQCERAGDTRLALLQAAWLLAIRLLADVPAGSDPLETADEVRNILDNATLTASVIDWAQLD